MKPFRLFLCCLLPLAAHITAMAGHTLLELEESLALLRQHGLKVKDEVVRETLLKALIEAVDPGGYVIESDRIDEEQELPPLPIPLEEGEMLNDTLYYIKVNDLKEGSGELLAEKLLSRQREQQAYGAIVDLRGAGGWRTEEALPIAAALTDEGSPLFRFLPAGTTNAHDWVASSGSKRIHFPLAVLIDVHTRGAAELLAAVLSDSAQGVILMGKNTQGDPGVRSTLSLSSGRNLYVTTHLLETAGGGRYDGTGGVRPHIAVSAQPVTDVSHGEAQADEADLSEEERQARALMRRLDADSILRRAVDLLLGLRALDKQSSASQPNGA